MQFAVNPETGELVVIEMNPRVSRSSALASKATGFPIAKIAARLAVGYTLDEIDNDITRKTPACFEPTLDYVVVKMPRWAFEKFPMADHELTTHMKSVGEAMAIGRTFKEAFLKALRSRELDAPANPPSERGALRQALAIPTAERYELVLQAFRQGMGLDELHELTGISPFFLSELGDVAELEREVREAPQLSVELLRRHKRYGFSDKRLGELTGKSEREVRALRLAAGVTPVFKAVDTCAAEFQADTPYFYSTYEEENEASRGREGTGHHSRLGPQPHRPGHRVRLLLRARRAHGARAGLRGGHGQLQPRDRLHRLRHRPTGCTSSRSPSKTWRTSWRNEKPEGVIVQFGGQTPLKIAERLAEAGIPIIGTPQDAIDLAEDRGRFGKLLEKLERALPPVRLGDDASKRRRGRRARSVTRCWCGRRTCSAVAPCEIVYDRPSSSSTCARGAASARAPGAHRPLPRGRIEVDVDALCDGDDVYIGAVMQHVEEAGVHSGDSACVIPPSLSAKARSSRCASRRRRSPWRSACVGLINVQFAYQTMRALRARGEPSRLAHGAVRQQGHGRAHGTGSPRGHPRRELADLGLPPARARARERQGSRTAVRALPGHRLRSSGRR